MRHLAAGRVTRIGTLLFALTLAWALALASSVAARTPPQDQKDQAARGGYVPPPVPVMPNPPGPAPRHDLTGVWIGPQNLVNGPFPAMTPAGEAKFELNKPINHVGDKTFQPTNDPFIRCDPLGFPRHLRSPTLNGYGAMSFDTAGSRMLILYELQRVWREVWLDGRPLPAKVDAAGYPDSRYYGYSVGHWEADNVFVIDTTGLDPRTWLDELGHPHTSAAKLQERYTRVDQYNLDLTVTIDDPAFYTRPYQLSKQHFYWKKDQDLEEVLCIPSEAIEYQDKLANPSGWGPGGQPAR